MQEVGGFADILSRMVLGKAGLKPEDVTFVKGLPRVANFD